MYQERSSNQLIKQRSVYAHFSAENVARALAGVGSGEGVVITVDPKAVSSKRFAECMLKAYEIERTEVWWAVRFFDVGDPVEADLVRGWTRSLIDEHAEVLAHAFNEKQAFAGGMPVFDFPGAGLYRLTALAGYGDWACNGDGSVSFTLDAVGLAIVGSFEYGGELC